MTDNGDAGQKIITRLTIELANAAREEDREIIVVRRQRQESCREPLFC